MSPRALLLLLAGGMVAAGLPLVPASAAPVPGPVDPPATVADAPAVARGIIVKTQDGASAAKARATAQRVVGPEIGTQSPDRLSGAISTIDFDTVVPVADAEEAAKAVAGRSDVVWAIPNRRVTASSAPPVSSDDPGFEQQHQLWDGRTTATDQLGTVTLPAGGYSVKAPSLWPATRGAGVVVAVLDTGILKNHPDLSNQLVAGYDFVSSDDDTNSTFVSANDGDGLDPDPSDPGDWAVADACGDGSPETDSSWHGSHVAGIIAAQAGNRLGISGIAPQAKIQPVRVLGSCGGWIGDIFDGIIWASGGHVDGVPENPTPARVINMSLGLNLDGDEADVPRYCEIYSAAVLDARDRGVVTVAAAGNDAVGEDGSAQPGDADVSVPASCPGVVSVAATSETGRKAFYSDTGSTVDLAAPGGDSVVGEHGVLSTINSSRRAPDLTPTGSTYAEYSGTSMATPAVAAGAALLFSRGASSPAQVEAALEASVSPFAPTTSPGTAMVGPSSDPHAVPVNCSRALGCGSGILDLSKVPWARTAPTVTGTRLFGHTLTAGSGTWAGAPGGFRYQWLRNGLAIAGATGRTHRVVGADLGRTISVRVSAGAAVYSWAAATSRTLDVARARSRVATALPRVVSRKKRARLVIKIAAAGVPAPTGRVVVHVSGRRSIVLRLSASRHGVLSVRLPRLAKGRHRVRVGYTGSSYVQWSRSAVRTIRSR